MTMTESIHADSTITVSPSQGGDIPTITAVMIARLPRILLRSGWIYLSTKRRARKSAKAMAKTMESDGVPPEIARMLADNYEEDISLSLLSYKERGEDGFFLLLVAPNWGSDVNAVVDKDVIFPSILPDVSRAKITSLSTTALTSMTRM